MDKKSKDFSKIIKIGRTHCMDATPLTLGQVSTSQLSGLFAQRFAFGQAFSAYVAQLDKAIVRIESTLPDLYELAQGGTAVGTGYNEKKQRPFLIFFFLLDWIVVLDLPRSLRPKLRRWPVCRLSLRPTSSKLCQPAMHWYRWVVKTELVGCIFFFYQDLPVGALNTTASSLMKIANDIRMLGSGPRCGLGEIMLPENEPGSSIMPVRRKLWLVLISCNCS